MMIKYKPLNSGSYGKIDVDKIEEFKLPKTAFKKKGNFAVGDKTVWLELNNMTLTECPSNKAQKNATIINLDEEGADFTISEILNTSGNSYTLVINVTTSKGKHSKAKSTDNYHYKTENAETHDIWLRTLRRIVGGNKAAAGKVNLGIQNLNAFHDAMCLIDMDGNILDINDKFCDLFGYEKPENSELTGCKKSELID